MANGCIYIGLLSKVLNNFPLIHTHTLMESYWPHYRDLPKDTSTHRREELAMEPPTL